MIYIAYKTINNQLTYFPVDASNLPSQSGEYNFSTEGDFKNILANALRLNFPASKRVPKLVTNAQFRSALVDSGIHPSQIDALIAGIPDTKQKEKADQWWNYANTIERRSLYVSQFAPAFSLSKDNVDDIFISAESQET